MRRRSSAVLGTTTACCLLLLPPPIRAHTDYRQVAEPPRPAATRTLAADRETFVIGAPAEVTGPRVHSVLPAPRGPHALLLREVPRNRLSPGGQPEQQRFTDGEFQVLLWNGRTGRTSVVWRRRVDARTSLSVLEAQWLSDSDTAAVQLALAPLGEDGTPLKGPDGEMVPGEFLVLLVGARGGTARSLPLTDQDVVHFSPVQPLAVIERTVPTTAEGAAYFEEMESSLRTLREDGTTGPEVPLPKGAALSLEFSETPDTVFVAKRERTPPPQNRRRYIHFSLDLKNGALTPLPGEPKAAKAAQERQAAHLAQQPIRLRASDGMLQDDATGVREPLRAVWLERQPHPGEDAGAATDARVLIVPDGEGVALLPDLSAALYLTRDGVLRAVPIFRKPAGAATAVTGAPSGG